MLVECFKGDILFCLHGAPKTKVARSEVAVVLLKLQPALLLPVLGNLLKKQALIDQLFIGEVELLLDVFPAYLCRNTYYYRHSHITRNVPITR